MPTSHRGAATRAAVVTTSAAVAAAIAALPATSSAPAAEPAAGPATATEVLAAAPIPQPFATPAPAPVPVAATASAATPAAVQVEAPGRRTGAAERKAAERKVPKRTAPKKAAPKKAASKKAASKKAASKKAASKKAAEAEPAASSSASSAGATALEHALDQKGDPYRWGATGPDAFDCSGLVVYAFSKAGVDLPRTSRAQSKVGERVSKDALRPGDLVFFYSPISHVGVYMGDGKIVHASTSGKPVKVSDMGHMEFHSARRV